MNNHLSLSMSAKIANYNWSTRGKSVASIVVLTNKVSLSLFLSLEDITFPLSCGLLIPNLPMITVNKDSPMRFSNPCINYPALVHAFCCALNGRSSAVYVR